MNKKPKQYNITPAKGQALLNFQGRCFADKVDLFEVEKIEEVRNNNKTRYNKEKDLNPDFTNLLLQGDCLSACAYLMSKNIKVDLVYIDPPFASGANYAKNIYLRNGGKEQIENDRNPIGEEVMYGDIWQKEDYLNWLYERLLAIREIMKETASIYIHLDWHIGHYVKILLDEVFGGENFINEIIWVYHGPGSPEMRQFNKKHDVIFWYSKSDKWIFNKNDIRIPYKDPNQSFRKAFDTGNGWSKEDLNKLREKGKVPEDWWEFPVAARLKIDGVQRTDYATEKPMPLLKRIIKASSNEGLIVADFFAGSGTTAKVARDLNRKFIACDIGINSTQTSRDRLIEAGANFDILKIKDGLRLFRNPTQTTAKIFSIIEGFKNRNELDLNDFWDGGIAQKNGSYVPVKFTGIHHKLTLELLDVFLEEIYKLEDISGEVNETMIIYAYKDIDIDQQYLNKKLNDSGKTIITVKLVSLDDLLGEKGDVLFMPDNADIKISKQGKQYKVEIKQFFSPYLKNKIDEYNAKRIKKNNEVKISENGLELIEAVQFDITLKDFWTSNKSLEDKAGIKEKIKGEYYLDTDKFKIKIRNIAGDEIIVDSNDLNIK
jgi:adenine-specific DNA-methyltransferase